MGGFPYWYSPCFYPRWSSPGGPRAACEERMHDVEQSSYMRKDQDIFCWYIVVNLMYDICRHYAIDSTRKHLVYSIDGIVFPRKGIPRYRILLLRLEVASRHYKIETRFYTTPFLPTLPFLPFFNCTSLSNSATLCRQRSLCLYGNWSLFVQFGLLYVCNLGTHSSQTVNRGIAKGTESAGSCSYAQRSNSRNNSLNEQFFLGTHKFQHPCPFHLFCKYRRKR